MLLSHKCVSALLTKIARPLLCYKTQHALFTQPTSLLNLQNPLSPSPSQVRVRDRLAGIVPNLQYVPLRRVQNGKYFKVTAACCRTL